MQFTEASKAAWSWQRVCVCGMCVEVVAEALDLKLDLRPDAVGFQKRPDRLEKYPRLLLHLLCCVVTSLTHIDPKSMVIAVVATIFVVVISKRSWRSPQRETKGCGCLQCAVVGQGPCHPQGCLAACCKTIARS